MISELHRLRDTLDYIHTWRDGDDIDPSAIDAALDIIERLLIQHERPDPIAPVGNCYRLPTPPPPPQPPVAAAASPKPKFGGRQKTTFKKPRRKTQQPQDNAA